MTYDEARNAMLAVVKAVVDANQPFVMLYPDVPGEPPATGPYGRTSVKHADGRQGSLAGATGVKLWDRVGTLWIELYAPQGDGNTAGYALAQAMTDAVQSSRAVWFRNVLMNEMGADGAFQRFDVKATFEYTDVR
jgi:hypothetical protein